jgi:hypothetical protein
MAARVVAAGCAGCGAIDKAARQVKQNSLRVVFSLLASGSECSGWGLELH